MLTLIFNVTNRYSLYLYEKFLIIDHLRRIELSQQRNRLGSTSQHREKTGKLGLVANT